MAAGASRHAITVCRHLERELRPATVLFQLLVLWDGMPAGSERIKKTQAAAGGGETDYEQLRESSCINKSLSFLEQVVNALARGDAHVPFRYRVPTTSDASDCCFLVTIKPSTMYCSASQAALACVRQHCWAFHTHALLPAAAAAIVPCCRHYRQSKLTAALRDAIGGNSNTVMIANLWPEEAHLEECVSTLRFASRVRCLQTDAEVNESADPLLALHKAERQIKELRQELAMRDMLSGRGRVVYEDLSDGERLELQQVVLRYLSGELTAAAAAEGTCLISDRSFCMGSSLHGGAILLNGFLGCVCACAYVLCPSTA